MTLLLYAITVVIWGTTWYAMIFQLGEVAPAASLTYRYLIAGLVLLAGAWASGRRVRLTGAEHLRCMVQGLLMFSFGYWLTYVAAQWLTTGIIALMFASASAVTMAMNAGLTRSLPPPRALTGAVLGVIGVGMVFWPEIAGMTADGPEARASLMVALSVVLFSAGGLVGARNQASGMPRFATIGWSMLYGAVVLAGLTLAQGEAFRFDWSAPYILSLLYLTLFGSVAVFVLYFEVIERIGAEKASYATVLFPLVALAVSTVAEDYHWPALALIGVPLALAGNALVLMRGRSPAAAGGAEREAQPVEGPVDVAELRESGRRAAE
jgi:drug/metabolite transporter (DMT)-like permease